MATSIFVMAHKPYNEPADPTYRTLQVGAAGKADIIPECLRDDAGDDNISDLNPYFSELTGIYWVWRNYKGRENIGVCHYRRYFTDEKLNKLTSDDFDKILATHDIITSKNIRTDATYRDTYGASHNVADLDALGFTLKKLYPEYGRAWDEVMAGHDEYFGNIFVMSRDLFDEYCQWMFSILMETMPLIDMTGYNTYQRRVYGFLTENLPLVFIKARELRVYECTVAYTSEKKETTELILAITELLHQKKTHEALSFMTKVLEVSPEVALPASDLKGDVEILKQVLFIKDHDETAGKHNFFTEKYDTDELIGFYKKCYDALSAISEGEDAENGKYLRDNGFDLFAANVILSNDPSERFHRTALDTEKIIKKLSDVCNIDKQ